MIRRESLFFCAVRSPNFKEDFPLELFLDLFGNILNFTWQEGLMLLVGGVLIYLAIRRGMEPALLLPMGFGAILVNLPHVNTGGIEALFNAGIANELFPCCCSSASAP